MRRLMLALLLLAGHAAAQGLEPDAPAALASFPAAPTTRSLTLPPQYVLTGLPPPRWQGRTSTCVAWAVAYAAGTYFHRARLAEPGAALSPGFAYALGNGDARCLRPSRISAMLDSLRDVGALPLSEWAFDPGWCGRAPTPAERARAATWRIPGWATVPAADLQAARAQLAQNRPVVFALETGTAFGNHKGAGVFDTTESGPDRFGHAMVAVGYDDTKAAFRIQNSAGTDWGDGGQAWLSYRVWQEGVKAGYVITDAQSNAPSDPGAALLARIMAALPPEFALRRAGAEAETRSYVESRTHKAFARSGTGNATYRGSGFDQPGEARESVLERCQVAYGAPCTLVAENDQVRAAAKPEATSMPRATYAGTYDPALVPGRPEQRAAREVQEYGKAANPKAMAWHHVIGAFAVVGAAGQREAEAEALRRCAAHPDVQRFGMIPCFLYATGNRVVLPQRATAPITPESAKP